MKNSAERRNQEQSHAYTQVYVMGNSDMFGFNSKDAVLAKPKLCSYNILIKQIACGSAHVHILSQDGFVYSMGRNTKGVLGLGQSEDSLQMQVTPQLIMNISYVSHISTGNSHTVALSAQGRVYSWGNSSNGATGIPN